MAKGSGRIGNATGWRRVRFLVQPQAIKPGEHRLAEAQSHYLTAVLRLKPGAVVHPFDGQGYEAVAVVKSVDSRRCVIDVIGPSEFEAADASLRVHVGQGMAARNRLDMAVEKLTESGASSITPIVDFGGAVVDKPSKLSDRWERICAAASAQCGRMTLPRVGEPTSVAEWDSRLPSDCLKLILSPTATVRMSQAARELRTDGEAAILVGRASGIDEKEEGRARDLGFLPVSLGERILRAETVGVIAMGVLLAAAGEY